MSLTKSTLRSAGAGSFAAPSFSPLSSAGSIVASSSGATERPTAAERTRRQFITDRLGRNGAEIPTLDCRRLAASSKGFRRLPLGTDPAFRPKARAGRPVFREDAEPASGHHRKDLKRRERLPATGKLRDQLGTEPTQLRAPHGIEPL